MKEIYDTHDLWFQMLKSEYIPAVTWCRAFNIFQVYQYFTVYRWYFFIKIWKKIHEYLIQHSLKSRGIKDHFRWVKYLVPSLIERPVDGEKNKHLLCYMNCILIKKYLDDTIVVGIYTSGMVLDRKSNNWKSMKIAEAIYTPFFKKVIFNRFCRAIFQNFFFTEK